MSRRSPEAEAYRRLYKDPRWCGPNGIRIRHLATHPVCARCKAKGFIVIATVVHHVNKASKATEQGFFAGPFMSLCAPCHDSAVQSEEKTGKANHRIGFTTHPGADGWPTDARHPANRR